jgi:hypothetical protein
MAVSIFDLIDIPRELTLEFLGTFARFEFALKKAGYAKGDDSKVSPDWDSFAADVAKLEAAVLKPVLDACPYLQQYPPRKQVLQKGALCWVVRHGTSGSVIGDVLMSVRTVRNNLFHGGKFLDGVITDPLRDERLINDSLSVLKGLLELPLPNRVADTFFEGL